MKATKVVNQIESKSYSDAENYVEDDIFSDRQDERTFHQAANNMADHIKTTDAGSKGMRKLHG